MAHTSTTPLASAVSLAGGLGVIGGLGYTPTQLRSMIHSLKTSSPTPNPFGIDLALPSLAPTARKTNHDYTSGKLSELIDVITEEGTTLFVSAVGVPDPETIARLHAAGVLVMNMVGHPKHARKAFDAGVDLVCAQGGEGGGHTGSISGNILVPACVDVARKYRPPALRGGTGLVVAAGGICDGRGLAAALAMGAVGVWVGTRFVASDEAGCSEMHKRAVVRAGWDDTMTTLVVSGRPLRVLRNAYLEGWEREERRAELKGLLESGKVPLQRDLEEGVEEGASGGEQVEVEFPFLMGQVAAMVTDVKPARQIVEDMVREAADVIGVARGYVHVLGSDRHNSSSKL
ncbi:MAG: hypothetical protein Q9191_003933 [Dirinaria sp. TL-2023a]